ncbi:hypothetical protein E4U43_000812 [Claviceps pusilla]|uniref:Uncharacterized protein n=1 Tax=Claviceps pusilla TaxID=123648 RepID=A0A9P7SYS5_9HYPO|nr:hypothetical protein E4U43_000812 [Claviceps pusilla]
MNLSAQNLIQASSTLLVIAVLVARQKPLMLLVALEFAPGLGVAVQDIMLHEKDAIVHKADVAERKFNGVSCDAAPVMLQVAIDALLPGAQEATGQVERDLPDAPALCALVAVVGQDLRPQLDHGNDELDVAQRVDEIEFAPVARGVDGAAVGSGRGGKSPGDEEGGEGAGRDADDEAAGTGARRAGEAPPRATQVLRYGDGGDDGGVQGKGDVVELDGWGETLVSGGVLAADEGGIVQSQGGKEVGDKSYEMTSFLVSRSGG